MQWRVKPALPVAKLIGAAALPALVAIFAPEDLSRWLLAGFVAAGIVVWAVRDLVFPVRLAADAAGVTVVTGFVRRRHVPWPQIERVRVDKTSRRGRQSEVLEIDAGDAVYTFTEPQLNAMPEEVAVELNGLRGVS
ncbi:PH domain-containing protein [Actinoplanes sp. NPDC023801]|uniref:PH domain-containing protein n=1 Tax=Actinoplanes sp. NPDC023801 TaxID=3154595 RepID=UPI0033E82B25